MMQWIKSGTKINFIGNRTLYYIITAFLITGSLLAVGVRGLNYGIDFAGGYEFQLHFPQPVKAENIETILKKAHIEGFSLQSYGDGNGNEYLLRIEKGSGIDIHQLEETKIKLKQTLGDQNLKEFTYNQEAPDRIKLVLNQDPGAEAIQNGFQAELLKVKSIDKGARDDKVEYQVALESVADRIESILKTELNIAAQTQITSRIEFVGPQVGEQLRNQGILAIIYSFAFMLIYIAIRFDFFFGPGAIVCLLHDTIVTVGAFALTGKEFNLQTIAALLTIVGYSMNDTIVVFDRIRENNLKMRGRPLEDIVNASLNETLSRTILTTFVTLLVVLSMMLFGGGVLADFGFALFIGFITGTYSSIAVAAPIYIFLRRKFDTSQMTTTTNTSVKNLTPKTAR